MTKDGENTSNTSDDEHIYYKKANPKAIKYKIILQMLIGAAIFLLLGLKIIDIFFSDILMALIPKIPGIEVLANAPFILELPNTSAIDSILNRPFLEIVGKALAFSAGIELAYMLFTKGPDEAVEPLILGISSAVLLLISRKEGVVGYEIVLTILVLTVCIGILFWVRERFVEKGKND